MTPETKPCPHCGDAISLEGFNWAEHQRLHEPVMPPASDDSPKPDFEFDDPTPPNAVNISEPAPAEPECDGNGDPL